MGGHAERGWDLIQPWTVPAPLETTGGTTVSTGNAVAGIHGNAPRTSVLPPLYRSLKRAADVLIAVVALVLTLPLLVVAAAAIVAESRGGVLFTQARVGAGGRPFRVVKLRTMRAGNDDREHRDYVAALIEGEAEPQDGIYKIVDDDRRTTVGRFLRSFSIDELPQFWNVLRGDMSVIGPRPPLPEEAALYDGVTWDRMAVKPGLTGLWQVSGRSRLTFEEMVELDIRYWREWSPLLDLRILLRTPKAVLWNRDTA
jgi:lipopolysaccharide/colanic/teichoic acid biosynthesis glycosyltransferase